jgi:hypothetical protein
MRMPHRLGLTALLLAGLAAPAAAQTRPPAVTPTRDVSIAYRIAGTTPVEMRISWLVARNLMRMDMGGGQGWMLVDTRAGSGVMIMENQRMIMDLPANQMPPTGMVESQTARYTREANARIANTDCTNWRVEDRGESARICLTTDGVMLRVEALSGDTAARGVMEATSVSFAPQDPARFTRPAGYQSFQMPAGLPQGLLEGATQGGSRGMPRGTAIPPPGLTPPSR